MKVYLVKGADFDALMAAIDRDPRHGHDGGSSQGFTSLEEEAHLKAHRFFNYQVRKWISAMKEEE